MEVSSDTVRARASNPEDMSIEAVRSQVLASEALALVGHCESTSNSLQIERGSTSQIERPSSRIVIRVYTWEDTVCGGWQ
eukprot:5591740-Amphidinium_carterae.1